MSTFDAMGTSVTVLVPGVDLEDEERLAQEVARLFAASEAVFSRFRRDSELSRLNRARGPFVASDELFGVLSRAKAHAAATSGVFDPAVAKAVVGAGYDRSFAPGRLDGPAPATPANPIHRELDAWRLDVETRRVERAPGVELDLGGIVKGFTVDLASALLPACSAVDAGGDAALRGDGPDGEGWLVDVEDPFAPARTLATLRLRNEAIATSAANRRAWRRGARTMHHLIDPRTGAPSEADVAQATVIAPTAELADVLAKAAFILGADAGSELLRASGVRGLLVLRDASVLEVGELEVCDG
jgi:thiamine biosynthesis lipoprotein